MHACGPRSLACAKPAQATITRCRAVTPPVACARAGPPGLSSDLAKRVELLRSSRWAAGVNGAGCDACTDVAWITLWRQETGGSSAGGLAGSEATCCAVAGCHKPAVRATHVWLHGGEDGTCPCFCKDYCYVLPVCRDHSARRFNLPTGGGSGGGRHAAKGDCGFRTKPGTRALRIRPHECYEDLRTPVAHSFAYPAPGAALPAHTR